MEKVLRHAFMDAVFSFSVLTCVSFVNREEPKALTNYHIREAVTLIIPYASIALSEGY